jgi:dipeptidyl aminopeptidase/acylaminoacyl peptidase
MLLGESMFMRLRLFGFSFRPLALAGWLVCCLGLAAPVYAQAEPELRALTTNDLIQPDAVKSVSLSPDGRYVAYLERTDEIDAIARRGYNPRRPESADFTHRIRVRDLLAPESDDPAIIGIGTDSPRTLAWGSNNRLLVGVIAVAKDNDHPRPTRRTRRPHYPFYWRLLSVDLHSGDQQVMFGDDGAWDMRTERSFATLIDPLTSDSEHVLIAAPHFASRFDLWRVDLATGDADLVERGQESTVDWRTNEQGQAVFRLDFDSERDRVRIYRRDDGERRWRRTDRLTLEEFGERIERNRRSIWVADTEDPDVVLVSTRPDDAERVGVYRYDLENDALGELVWEHDHFDVQSVIRNYYTHQLIAVTYVDDRLRLRFMDRRLNAHYRAVSSFFETDAVVRPVQVVDDAMLLLVSGPQEPGSYYAYRMPETSVTPIAVENPVLLQTRLSPVTVETYQARDGQEIMGYLTRPLGHDMRNMPMIIFPHGGPELRDEFGFDFVTQYFASEGWAVFQPNFRGSAGMGRTFEEAGHQQWSLRMQADVTDGVRWLIEQGYADPDRICIAGFSYGGYAALAGAVVTPDLYRCAVSVAGVTDLPAFLAVKAEGDEEVHEFWLSRMGDPNTDLAALEAASPTRRADEIRIPVLLLHGTEDEIVPLEQSTLMRTALESAGVDYRFRTFEGGDHDFAEPIILARALALMTAFLGESLDGEAGPGDRRSWDDLTTVDTFNFNDRVESRLSEPESPEWPPVADEDAPENETGLE